MSNFEKDLQFSLYSMNAWKKVLQEKFNPYKIHDYETDIPLQTSGWDLELVFTGEQRPLRVEIKTRRYSYFEQYTKDNKILIELIGNTDENKIGSGISNSFAELWCYGWFNGKEILNPLIFDKSKLLDWVITNPDKMKINYSSTLTSTNPYNTKFGLVKFSLISHLIYGCKKTEGLDVYF